MGYRIDLIKVDTSLKGLEKSADAISLLSMQQILNTWKTQGILMKFRSNYAGGSLVIYDVLKKTV